MTRNETQRWRGRGTFPTGELGIVAMRAVAVRVAVVLATIQVVVGTVWWLADLTGLPAYGDTPEYLQLAEDLRVDGYRTLAYPLLVRLASTVAEPLGVPLQVPIYLLQTVVAAGAAWYLVRTAAPRARRGVVAFAAATIVTSPLVVHYATSLLTDSLAASAFVVALAGLARVVVDGNTARGTLAVTAGASLGAALLRTEKATVLLVVAVATGAWLVFVRRRRAGPTRGWITPVAAVLVLAVPALLGSAINRATQTADYGRPEAGVAAAAMSRVVWPHLAEIRDELPADVRAQLSAEDATAFDSDNNYALWMVPRMREMDGGGDDVVWTSVRAALRCCAVEVVAMAGLDAVEYAVAPVTFAVEGAPRAFTDEDPDTTPSAWNLTRLSAHRPDLSRALLGVGFLLLAAQLVAVVVNRPRRWAVEHPDARRRVAVLGLVWLGTVANGCFFALAMGADANVRYGLGTVMALTGALAVLSISRADDPAVSSKVEPQASPG